MSLHDVAQAMVAKPRGILAADESTGTCKKRFDSVGVECTEEHRRAYRGMLFTTDDIGTYISGVIMFSETLTQTTEDGVPFPHVQTRAHMIPGIKVDLGLDEQPNGEKLTKGLDDLPERLQEYKKHGAQFAKWRAVIMIGAGLPTAENIHESARRLAQYAKNCQDAGIVPIVEPEVLIDGDHSIERCAEVTRATLVAVFKELDAAGVDIKGMVLKPNMVVPGKDAKKATPEEVADATVTLFSDVLPDELPGVAFLSGGIGDEDVTLYLNAMNKRHKTPWNLTFSFGRGLQRGALAAFGKGDLAKGQASLLERAKASSAATMGEYN